MYNVNTTASGNRYNLLQQQAYDLYYPGKHILSENYVQPIFPLQQQGYQQTTSIRSPRIRRTCANRNNRGGYSRTNRTNKYYRSEGIGINRIESINPQLLSPSQNSKYSTNYTKAELAVLLRDLKLDGTGTKAELYQRLRQLYNM